jgi:hypothetical protein
MAKLKQPSFSGKSRLVRYVRQSDRLRGNRIAIAAFEPDVSPSGEPITDNHLSVNSLEVETLKQISAYHRLNWQGDEGEVALIDHQVTDYNDAAKKCEVAITLDVSTTTWMFVDTQRKSALAYKHRPVRPNASNELGSPSHCGVEFIRVLNEYRATQFARRLAGKGRFHLIK